MTRGLGHPAMDSGTQSNEPDGNVRAETRLRMIGIVKQFSGTLALDHVDFDVRVGEVHALLGQNGAGKSTLIRILAGIYAADAGQVEFDGSSVIHLTPHSSHAIGMRFIHQELNLVPWFSVAENIVLGDPYPKRGVFIDWRRLNRQAGAVLERFNIAISPTANIQKLSVGEQWLVAIARALYTEGKLLVMDEPTASLSKREVTDLLGFINSLRKHGTSIVYISHRLQEVFDVAQRATIFRDGKKVVTCEVAELTVDGLAEYMVGKKASQSQVTRTPPRSRPAYKNGQHAVFVSKLSVGEAVQDVSFHVARGEVVGLTGLIGAGKTEVGKALFGLARHEGEIRVDGERVILRSPRQAIKRKIALVPEERRRQSLVLDMTVRENLTLAYISRYRRRGLPLISKAAERRRAREMIDQLQVKTDGLEVPIRNLSGGNQQKIVLGRWLQETNSALILDEPTRGIDVGARFEIFKFVRKLADAGVAVLYISSDVDEIMHIADRVLVMQSGQIVADLPLSDTTLQEVLEYCYGQTHSDAKSP